MTTTTLHSRLAVPAAHLRRRLDPASLPFGTTAEVEPLVGTIGQPRAIDAIAFGLEVSADGYNLYVAGTPGSGRETAVMDALKQFAATRPAPSDWVYVHNFVDPAQPRAIALPPGKGGRFAKDMHELVESARREIPRAFDSEDFARRQEEAIGDLTRQRDELFQQTQAFAAERGFTIQVTPAGVITVPVMKGRPLSGEEFERLRPEVKQELTRRSAEIQERIADTLRTARQIEKQAAERVNQLVREVALFVVGPHLDDLRQTYGDSPEILTYLDQVQNDLPEHLHDFMPAPGDQGMAPFQQLQQEEHLARYEVNVFIDNSRASGAPVIYERNPSYYNVLGRIDYRASFGAMTTDFRQIHPGALHRANGGFLILQVIDLLRSPYAWDGLKRALLCHEVQVENLGEQLTPLPTARLRPEPIPLNVKVILIGLPEIYHLMLAADEDFQELFKVKADFAPDMTWSDEHVHNYAAFVSGAVRRHDLRHFDRGAVARIVEHGGRLREDQRKLSTRLLDIENIVIEASFWAGKAGHEIVQAEDVDTAVAKRIYRSNLIEERVRELIDDGTIMIDTTGERIGQVNGISVIDLGDYAFGQPSRITARVALGRGAVVSVEREIELSGPIHAKGVLILSGYLSGQYGMNHPLAAAATITFEQSYNEVEGDSASSAELYALLSAIAGMPLAQGIAVTGSVNQHGQIQAVGGVTHKIEGFFAVCKAKGLTGEQGVIIPAANVPNLMLNDEVATAVGDGRFHVWAVRTVDEGIELLTGRPAGERRPDGTFPEGTFHRLVDDNLTRFAERLRVFGTPQDGSLAGQRDAARPATGPTEPGAS